METLLFFNLQHIYQVTLPWQRYTDPDMTSLCQLYPDMTSLCQLYPDMTSLCHLYPGMTSLYQLYSYQLYPELTM